MSNDDKFKHRKNASDKRDEEEIRSNRNQVETKPTQNRSEIRELEENLQDLRVDDSKRTQVSIKTRDHAHGATNAESCKNVSATSAKYSIKLGNNVFNHWMNSREPKTSLWSDETLRSCLLSYIGSIYGQKGHIGDVLAPLRIQFSKSDELDQLNEIIQRLEKQPGAKESFEQWQQESRSSQRLEDLKILFEYDNLPASKLDKWNINLARGLKTIIDAQLINGYYDLICRDGLITAEIGKYLDLNKSDILGGNDYDSNNDEMTFVKTNLDQSIIDLPDNRVGLITCFVTLHHVPNLNEMLIELTRILCPNGYLILREHDCKKERSLRMKYLNFIHAFMMIARIGEFAHISDNQQETTSTDWKQLKCDIINYTSGIQYHTRDEWNQMLKNVGFQWIATMDFAQSRNPQALYYAVYQLNSKKIN